jgi:antirestriction protein ArdC
VRKGEHGAHVYFADKFVPQKEQHRAKDEGTDPSAIHFIKRYTVFNAEQCEGLPVGLFGIVEPRHMNIVNDPLISLLLIFQKCIANTRVVGIVRTKRT